MSAAYLLLLLLPLASAQTFGWGPCRKPLVQANFTLEEFMGQWFLIEKLPALMAPGRCISSNLTLMENDTVHVENCHVFLGSRWCFDGVMVTPDMDEPAKLITRFSRYSPFVPDWVLDTDYSGYSVVYSCMNVFHLFHVEYAWILSRSPSLDPETLHRSKELLEKEGIDVSRMREVNHDHCMDRPKPMRH